MTSWRQWRDRQRFQPGILGVVLNPFYFARRGLHRGLAEFMPHLNGRVLDVGCGRKPYRDLVPATEYVGVDVDTPVTRELGTADVLYDGKTLPFADESFDGVLCSQVLEHVFEPEAFLAELKRVLRPGGMLLLATPFAWDEHEQPYDFGRYSSFGLSALLTRAGFEVVAQRKCTTGAAAVAQLASGYVYKATRSRWRVANVLAQLCLVGPLNVAGWFADLLLPRHQDLYLDNIIWARNAGKPAA